MTTTAREHAHDLYRASVSADDALTAACAHIGARDRWCLTSVQTMDPAVRAAYYAKLDADQALLTVFRNGAGSKPRT